jgi:hypothetical protein
MPYFLTWKIFYTVFIFYLRYLFVFEKALWWTNILYLSQVGMHCWHISVSQEPCWHISESQLLAIVISMLSSSCLALTQFPKVLTIKYTYLFHLGHAGSLIYLFFLICGTCTTRMRALQMEISFSTIYHEQNVTTLNG